MPRWVVPGYLGFLALALTCLYGATPDLERRTIGGVVLVVATALAIGIVITLDKKNRR